MFLFRFIAILWFFLLSAGFAAPEYSVPVSRQEFDVRIFQKNSARTRVVTPAGAQSWTYDDFGGVESWTLDGVTQFEVTETDLLGRPTEIDDFSGVREIVYDNDKWTLDTVEWTYGSLEGFKLDEDADARGRLGGFAVSKDEDELYSVSHSYRGESGRIDTMTVVTTGAPTVSITVSGPGGKADQLSYSVNGQNTVTYSRSRDPNGRMNGISAPGFNQSWTFDAMGRVEDRTTNGKTTTHGYDPVNGSLASSVSTDESRTYTFNDKGELEEETVGADTLAMIPDPDQSGAATGWENLRKLTLKGAFHTNAVVQVLVGTNVVHNTSVTPFTFTLDETTVPALSNPSAVVPLDWSVVGTRPGAEYEGGNAVAEIAGHHLFAPAEEPILYDLASRRDSDAFLDYDWNAANQPLTLEELHGPHRTEHLYDASQRRIEKQVFENGILQRTHRFVYDGWLPVVEEVIDQWGGLEYRNLYVWGPGPDGVRNPGIGSTGQLALIIHQPASGAPQLSAPVYNHRLDVVALVDVETGNVVARYGYTPFGVTKYAVGARADQNPFRFAGAYWDDETETAYFGYRHYHPRTKQWISRDPIGEAGGLNLFAYCDNEPIGNIDILGLRTVPWDTGWKVVDGTPMVRLGEMKVSLWTGRNKGMVPGSEEWVPATGRWLESFKMTDDGWIYPGANAARQHNNFAAMGGMKLANQQFEKIGLGYWSAIGLAVGGTQSYLLANEIASKGFFIWYHGAKETGQRGLFWWSGTLVAAGAGANMQAPVSAPRPKINPVETAKLSQRLSNYSPDVW
ncbi:MAG: RHS repeat-associated core domain-containing protein [Kiritimatiellae bacterium]|jgi:RHS repeat-associated protein|nr:RHS repeat-associated core domain-containing protein [Kiritimatiellia bacterium]